jgi:LAS superfamily LD-carboxypeptidase LdcB
LFSRGELNFLEELFFTSARRYGFFGQKVQDQITAVVPKKDRYKVPYTGHFLYRGESFKLYQKVRNDLGREIVLSSGIRSIVKQSYLFLAKTIQTGGNLSRASRSLAPPGHSFHGVGDFDVGKKGFGLRNFTTAFARTKEFRRLVELGYVAMRYPQGNLLGVRFEPWHIKVV